VLQRKIKSINNKKHRPTGNKKTVVAAADYLRAKTKYSSLTAVLK
jgi:hypothetical protein